MTIEKIYSAVFARFSAGYFLLSLSEKPNIEKISRSGMQNAKLGGVQGMLQLAIIFVMANIRFR